MTTRLLLTFILSVIFTHIYSQDTIIRINGSNIICKIQKEDSAFVYFTMVNNKREVPTFIHKNEILEVVYSKNSFKKQSVRNWDRTSIGTGIGLDYGGFGGNVLIYPHKNIGVFAGAGYALAKQGYNYGVKIRFIKNEFTSGMAFHFLGMYGYNTSIIVFNESEFNKLFYGPSFGFGFDYKPNQLKNGYWTMALLIPIRGSEVDNYINKIEYKGVGFKKSLLPVAFSVGYRFIKK